MDDDVFTVDVISCWLKCKEPYKCWFLRERRVVHRGVLHIRS